MDSSLPLAIGAVAISIISSAFLLYLYTEAQSILEHNQDRLRRLEQASTILQKNLTMAEDKINGLEERAITLENEIFRLQGLVGYWNFDEGEGTTATDRIGYANTGMLVNAPTWLHNENCAVKTNGAGSSCLGFDGVDDYIVVPRSSSTEPSDEITITLWVKAKIPRGALVDKAFTNHTYPFYSYNLQLEPNTDQPTKAELIWSVTTDGVWTYLGEGSSEVLIDLNSWQFVAVVYDGSHMKEYVNGELKASAPKTGTITYYDTPLQLARYVNFPFHTTADIDDVRIYDRALPVYDIEKLYQNGK
ncbi:MAG: LamG domain-containing protein [Nitrososphaera sp.]